MLFASKNENSELYKHFFKNTQYKVYNINDALIIKMANGFSNSGTEVVKMTHKLGQAKAKKGDQGLLLNSDVVKQKSKELRKLIQKKKKLKELNKAIQSIKENNDAKTKLIEKLKKKVCKAIKEIITAKSINKENELSNNDDLKNSVFTSKNSKNKSEFTKSAVSTQSSSHIQAQFINSISIGKPSPSTSSQSRLIILSY